MRAQAHFDPSTFYDEYVDWMPGPTDVDEEFRRNYRSLIVDDFRPSMYHTFTIPKRSGGLRTITAPNSDLMGKQRALLAVLSDIHRIAPNTAHAYYKHRSIRSMAIGHVGKRWVIKIDLKDFFPRIRPDQVKRCLRRITEDEELIRLVDKWCFINNGLPQGAPTSPILSNIVAGSLLDRRLVGLVHLWRRRGHMNHHLRVEPIHYTRYADDLCFSSNYPDLPKIVPVVRNIIQDSEFTVNEDKIHIVPNTVRQTVCGVSLNRHIGKPRAWRYDLKAMIHNITKDVENGVCRPWHYWQRAEDGIVALPIPIHAIRGCIAHVDYLNPNQANILYRRYDEMIAVNEWMHHAELSQEPDAVRLPPRSGWSVPRIGCNA